MQAHIVRIDARYTHGWQLRIRGPKTRGSYESHMFSDSRHGGKQKARLAAERELREKLGDPKARAGAGRTSAMMFLNNPSQTMANNQSGKTGVYKSRLARGRGKKKTVQQFWAAYYSIGADGTPTRGTKRFYFGTVRSERTAKRLAVDFRKRWEQAYIDGGARGVKRFFRETAQGA